MNVRTRQSERGVAAVEFALVVPLFLVLAFGTFEFGLAFFRKQELTSAVREGARAGIVSTNPRVTSSTITSKVTTYMTNVGLSDTARTASCTGCPCTGAGASLTVTATYPTNFTILNRLPYAGGIAASKTLTATVVMQCE
jgi:Flp pilus assembly protein TadG